MQAIDQPEKVTIPFAVLGVKRPIPEASQIGITDGAASFTDGFPPKTFLPLAVGGIPPAGADFNGVFNYITDIQRWQSAGGQFKFDAVFAAAVGGYPKGARLAFADNTDTWINTVDDNETDPDGVGAAGWVAFSTPEGAELSGFKQTGAWAVARTVADKLGEIISAEDAGAVGDGVTDDSVKIQAQLTAGKTVRLTAGKTYVAKNLVSVSGAGLTCLVGRATIKVPAGSGYSGLFIMVSDFTLNGVDFDGGNLGPYNVYPPVAGNRNGIVVGNVYGTGIQLTKVSIANCDIHGFDNYGVYGRETVIGFSFGKRVMFHNVNCYSNFIGFLFEPRFEYATLTNCYGYQNYCGIAIGGGNNTLVASHFESNWDNLQLNAGENDGHGEAVGCSFNHAESGGTGIFASGITNGFIFTACALFYAPIKLSNCAGIFIRHCQIYSSHITITGGGVNGVDSNQSLLPLTKTLTGNTFTTFRNNRTTPTDVSFVPVYGDVAVTAAALTYSFPLAWNATVDTTLPLVFNLKKWQGEDLAALDTSGKMYIPRTGQFQLDARLKYTVGAAAEKVVLRVVLVRATVEIEEWFESVSLAALVVDGTISINTRIFAQQADIIKLTLRVATATGITINTGGIKVMLTSVDN